MRFKEWVAMSRFLPRFVAVAIVIAASLVEGRWAGRGATEQALAAAAARLQRVPWSVGDWQGSDTEIDRQGLARMGINGLVARRYVDRRTGDAVSVLLACGGPGPIAVHGPEICYAGAGYEPLASLLKTPLAGAEFWRGDFRQRGAVVPHVLRVYWAWNATGRWQAAAGPRLQFAGKPFLYKLYLIQEGSPGGARFGADRCPEFAAALLPELDEALFANS